MESYILGTNKLYLVGNVEEERSTIDTNFYLLLIIAIQWNYFNLQALLLLSKYNDKTVNVDLESNLSNIENAYEMFGMWEKSLVRFAHYQDRILNTMTPAVYYTKGL